MPITYHCDNCDITAESLSGWKIVQVTFMWDNPANVPPQTRQQEGAPEELIFHSDDCRNVWCEKAGMSPPVAVPAS